MNICYPSYTGPDVTPEFLFLYPIGTILRAGGLGNISKRQDKLWYVGEDGYSSQAFYHLLQIEGVEHVQVLK